MRLLRLKLKNYRGIRETEVEFRENGVTVIEGNNETGKTSIGEAVLNLFTFKSSSRHRKIEALKPVNLDEGPEIELECVIGSVHITYWKRYMKRHGSRLTVHGPAQKVYEGDEAHDRAEAILKEHIDDDLWKALCVEQGSELKLPDLTEGSALAAALDRAAGGLEEDPASGTLLDRAREEYSRFYTESRGNLQKKFKEDEARIQTLNDKVASTQALLEQLSQAADTVATLQGQLAGRRGERDRLKDRKAGLEKRRDEIRKLTGQHEVLSYKVSTARKALEDLTAKRDERASQRLKLAEVEAALSEAEAVLKKAEAAENGAGAELSDFEKRRTAIEESIRDTRSGLRMLEKEVQYHRDQIDREMMGERIVEVEKVREARAQAQVFVAEVRVTEDKLKQLERAEKQLDTAQAVLDSQSPSASMTAMMDIKGSLDGEHRTFESGVHVLRFRDSLEVDLPGVLDLKVSAGASLSSLRDSRDRAKAQLAHLLAEVHARSVEEARNLLAKAKRSLEFVAESQEAEARLLRDLSYEQLKAKYERLLDRILPYTDGAEGCELRFPDLDAARTALDAAERAGQDIDQQLVNAGREETVSRKRYQEAREALEQARLAVARLKRDRDNLYEAVRFGIESLPDDALAVEIAKAEAGLREEQEAEDRARRELDRLRPEETEQELKTAADSLESTERQVRSLDERIRELQRDIAEKGGMGLGEQLEELKAQRDVAVTAYRSAMRQAEAAKLLRDTLEATRNEQNARRVKPLKDEIEHLGRLVYNRSFEAELDEKLAIVTRTLDGVTVPYESLSGGTKEQLSIIARLAAASLVSPGKGGPVMLDDTLGYTDSERLMAMGTVISKAAEKCQVIVFTCVPQRYTNIGNARRITLDTRGAVIFSTD